MKKEHVIALFEMAGFTVKSMHELPNGYWPEAYVELRKASPWWLVETDKGLIKVGRRKRVWSVNWEATTFRAQGDEIVSGDHTTFSETYCHAWSYLKLLAYLDQLARAMQ